MRKMRKTLVFGNLAARLGGRLLSSSASSSGSGTGGDIGGHRKKSEGVAAAAAGGSLALNVADPTLLLNNIANRYQSAHRVLLEYVDNALDDAEEAFREANPSLATTAALETSKKRAKTAAGSYPSLLKVVITIDHASRSVRIDDNSRGMNEERLRHLVSNIGASTKRGCSWVNGRFGFGVHAFRAAAHQMTILSKTKGHEARMIRITRDDTTIIPPRKLTADDPSPPVFASGGSGGSGVSSYTSVVIERFSVEWFRNVQGAALLREVSNHFDRVLLRGNLEIEIADVIPRDSVGDLFSRDKLREMFSRAEIAEIFPEIEQDLFPKAKPKHSSEGEGEGEEEAVVSSKKYRHEGVLRVEKIGGNADGKGEILRIVRRCRAVDYNAIEGRPISCVLDVEGKDGKVEHVLVHLIVARRQYAGCSARFFSRGRRIAEISNVSSFLAHSKRKGAVWAHPQLVGFVEVGDAVEPVITRDDFVQSSSRSSLYSGLLELESKIESLLSEEMELQHSRQMDRIAVLFSKMITKQLRMDKKEKTINQQKKPTAEEKLEIANMNNVDAGDQENQNKTDEMNKQPEEETEEQRKQREKEEMERAEAKLLHSKVQFVSMPPLEDGSVPRFRRVQDILFVNTAHPDFEKRAQARGGGLKIGDRLTSYISCIVAAHYQQLKIESSVSGPPSASFSASFVEELIEKMVAFEDSFQKKLPSLKKMDLLEDLPAAGTTKPQEGK